MVGNMVVVLPGIRVGCYGCRELNGFYNSYVGVILFL